jgi:hypothetical protein
VPLAGTEQRDNEYFEFEGTEGEKKGKEEVREGKERRKAKRKAGRQEGRERRKGRGTTGKRGGSSCAQKGPVSFPVSTDMQEGRHERLEMNTHGCST